MKYTYYKMKGKIDLFIRTKDGRKFEARWADDDPTWEEDPFAGGCVKSDHLDPIPECEVVLEML